jgi:hypothetical protein
VQHSGLAVLEHDNWIAYLTGVVACSRRAEVTRAGGAVAILTDLPFDWFNQVLIEREGATPAGVLAGVDKARKHGDPFVVRLRDGIDDRFVVTLARAGLVAKEQDPTTPGMAAFPIDRDTISVHAPRELRIRRVTDTVGIDAHRLVATAGFGTRPEVASGTACLHLLDRPGCVIYVGYDDGEPVVSGLGWRTGRTIGVYSIATIESARRRGFGAAMTVRIMADGVAAGCDVAVLQASELGRPIYERVGFRTVVTYRAYGDAGPPATKRMSQGLERVGS